MSSRGVINVGSSHCRQLVSTHSPHGSDHTKRNASVRPCVDLPRRISDLVVRLLSIESSLLSLNSVLYLRLGFLPHRSPFILAVLEWAQVD
jgi:hypothetical protein